MITISFLLIILGISLLTVSLMGAVYRMVGQGGFYRRDEVMARWFKIGLTGLVMALLGQLIVWLVL